MTLNKSYIAALSILVAVSLLFIVGTLLQAGQADSHETANTGHDRLFEVVTRTVTAQPRAASLSLRGRTEAFREVLVRAETGGRVAEAAIVEGSEVEAGDVLCRLDVDARSAAVGQAEADLRSRELDFNAARELAERGHRSTNQVAAAEAARDAAQARLQAAREELDNIYLRAPFDGVFDGRAAEVGDFLRAGDPCGTVVEMNPILVVAEVSERNVSALEPGMPGRVNLVTGQQVDGQVRFVERRADQATRTFRVEVELPNEDMSIRSGVTAEVILQLPGRPAHRVPASILALDSEGELGIRIVEDDHHVRFVRIDLLSDDGEQVWVAGLPETANIIVLGQEFVADGVEVRVAREGDAR